MMNITNSDLIVTISDKGKNVFKTTMPAKKIRYFDDHKCIICFDDVDPDNAFIPKCGHLFHVSCMAHGVYSYEESCTTFPDRKINMKCTRFACEHAMILPMTFVCPTCRQETNVHVCH